MTKTCVQCNETKFAEEEFYRSKRNKDGRDSYCKECRNGRHAAHVAKQRESRPPRVSLAEKKCTKCGEVKKLSEFYAGRGLEGRRGDCKICRDAYHDEYAKRPEIAARLAEQRRNRASGKWKRPPRRLPHADGYEVCTMCNEDKAFAEFHDHKLGRNGKDSVCKQCRSIRARERNRDPVAQVQNHRKKAERVYGLAVGQYDSMLDEQDGLCAICRRERPNGKRLVVDHDHDTDVVRGLLCTNCNLGLGSFRDDIDLMLAAAAYLEHHRLPLSVNE
jgi:hypothetical protein